MSSRNTATVVPSRRASPLCAMTPTFSVFLDGDGSDPAEFIPDLVSPIVAGQAVFVLGSRVRGSREPGSLAPQQLLAAHVGGLLLRLVYGASFTDLSPFRAIRRDELIVSA